MKQIEDSFQYRDTEIRDTKGIQHSSRPPNLGRSRFDSPHSPSVSADCLKTQYTLEHYTPQTSHTTQTSQSTHTPQRNQGTYNTVRNLRQQMTH